jgi:cytidylate kinase
MQAPSKKIIIAIDGHSSSGKSTFAREIAGRLGYTFINTGAMYRAVTLYALRHGAFSGGVLDRAKLIAMLPDIDRQTVMAGGSELHSIEVSSHVSAVSAVPEVREKLIAIQREIGRGRGVVMEGRDIGTVVFPDAELKIFLTADPAVRARRRWAEMSEVPLDEIERNIRERDKADAAREISPLRRADDALVLDNSNMTLEEQIEWVLDKLTMEN